MNGVKDVENEIKDSPDEIVEDFSLVDMNLPSKVVDEIMADERLINVVSYQRLKSRLEISKLSETANTGVGNKEQALKHAAEQRELEAGLAYCKRAIKYLDSKFPKAKEIMLKKAENTK